MQYPDGYFGNSLADIRSNMEWVTRALTSANGFDVPDRINIGMRDLTVAHDKFLDILEDVEEAFEQDLQQYIYVTQEERLF